MNSITQFAFIRESFFLEHPEFKEILKFDDKNDETARSYLCLVCVYKNNSLFIPLRSNIKDPIEAFGQIGFLAPSDSRPKAGLDYRKLLIINDDSYLEYSENKIPRSQSTHIEQNYEKICKEVISYIEGYISTYNKGRVSSNKKFKFSSLCNFHKEIGI